MSKLNIRSRLLLGFGLILLIFVSSVMLTFEYVQESRRLLSEVAQVVQPLELSAASLDAENSVAVLNLADRLKEVIDKNLENLNRAAAVMALSAFMAINLGLLLSFVITRSIMRPLSSIVEIARRAGEGLTEDDKNELEKAVSALSSTR